MASGIGRGEARVQSVQTQTSRVDSTDNISIVLILNDSVANVFAEIYILNYYIFILMFAKP